MTQTNIPQRYKDSPFGIIPKEWEVKTLNNLGKIYSGGTPSTENAHYWNGEILWCIPSDITNLQSKYIYDTRNKISDLGLKNSSVILLPKGSIVVCTRATIGNIAITVSEISTNQGFKNIVPFKQINTEWLFYIITLSKNKFIRLGRGSIFLEVSKIDFSKIKFPIPPLAEQKKIAEVLRIWDRAIEKLTQLVEKLELRKKGLMQQLLTGKKRLPGFTDKWQHKKLNEVCKKITTGKLDANAMKSDGKYRFYTCAKEYYKIDTYAFDTEALLISGNGANVGYIHYYKGKFNPYQRTYVLYNFNQSIFFIKYYLDVFLKRRIDTRKSESNTPYIQLETISAMNILLPSLAEQTTIANILTTSDNKIEIQRKKLEQFVLKSED